MSETREIIIVNCPECGGHHHDRSNGNQAVQPSANPPVRTDERKYTVGTVVKAGIVGGIIGALIVAALCDD